MSPARCSWSRSRPITCSPAASSAFAKRSIIVASAFGLAAALCVVDSRRRKRLHGFGKPEDETRRHRGHVADRAGPGELQSCRHSRSGATARSTTPSGFPGCSASSPRARSTQPIPGIDELVAQRRGADPRRVSSPTTRSKRCRPTATMPGARRTLRDHAADLGYALLLKRYVADPRKADDATIAKAAASTVPDICTLFWSFRIMVGLGFYFIAFFALLFWDASHRNFSRRWLLRLGAVVAAAALDRRRAWLGGRRIRPPALGDRRRAADLPGVVVGVGRPGAVHAVRLRPVLFGAARRRHHADAQIHPSWGRSRRWVSATDAAARGRCRQSRGRPTMPSRSTTKPSGSSGGCFSACC